MKSIIIASILGLSFFSNSAIAQFDMLQNEMSRTVAQLSSVDAVIKSVKLNETGVLTVVTHNGFSKSLKLSENNCESLLNAAKALTETELTIDERINVCEIYILPHTIQNLSVIDLNSNSLRLVLSPSSCAFASYTHPANEYALELAKNLKAQLIALARQTTEQQVHILPMPAELQ